MIIKYSKIKPTQIKILAKFKHVKFNTHIENSNHSKKCLTNNKNNLYGICVGKYTNYYYMVLLVSPVVITLICKVPVYLKILKSVDFLRNIRKLETLQ